MDEGGKEASRTRPQPSAQQNRFPRKKQNHRDSSRPRTIIGKSVSAGLVSIKGADLTVNKYVSRFHIDTTVAALREYISQKGVEVVELEEIKTVHSRYKSFRLRVKRSELNKIEDARGRHSMSLLSSEASRQRRRGRRRKQRLFIMNQKWIQTRLG